MRDDAADWADEKPLRHRCGVPDYYGCRVCMYASDDPDDPPEVCPKCKGDGVEELSDDNEAGRTLERRCWMCDGKGMIH